MEGGREGDGVVRGLLTNKTHYVQSGPLSAGCDFLNAHVLIDLMEIPLLVINKRREQEKHLQGLLAVRGLSVRADNKWMAI